MKLLENFMKQVPQYQVQLKCNKYNPGVCLSNRFLNLFPRSAFLRYPLLVLTCTIGCTTLNI